MMILWLISSMTICFFFNDTATTEIYTLSLHDALPILHHLVEAAHRSTKRDRIGDIQLAAGDPLGLQGQHIAWMGRTAVGAQTGRDGLDLTEHPAVVDARGRVALVEDEQRIVHAERLPVSEDRRLAYDQRDLTDPAA